MAWFLEFAVGGFSAGCGCGLFGVPYLPEKSGISIARASIVKDYSR